MMLPLFELTVEPKELDDIRLSKSMGKYNLPSVLQNQTTKPTKELFIYYKNYNMKLEPQFF